MLHPVMTIRPDEVVRSGIWQPFGVRATSPVKFARHEIDPFIRAIRPAGSMVANIDGASGLGITQAATVPLLGQTDTTTSFLYGAGLFLAGALGGFFLGRMMGGKRRR